MHAFATGRQFCVTCFSNLLIRYHTIRTPMLEVFMIFCQSVAFVSCFYVCSMFDFVISMLLSFSLVFYAPSCAFLIWWCWVTVLFFVYSVFKSVWNCNDMYWHVLTCTVSYNFFTFAVSVYWFALFICLSVCLTCVCMFMGHVAWFKWMNEWKNIKKRRWTLLWTEYSKFPQQ